MEHLHGRHPRPGIGGIALRCDENFFFFDGVLSSKSVAKSRAEEALATLQRELKAKQDANIMLNLQLEKTKQQKSEEEAMRRSAVAEVHQLKQELSKASAVDESGARELAQLRDAVASLQVALEKEKNSRAALQKEMQRAEESASAALRVRSNEADSREAKLKKELQEASEHILRLRADAKVKLGKEHCVLVVMVLPDKLAERRKGTRRCIA